MTLQTVPIFYTDVSVVQGRPVERTVSFISNFYA